MSVTDNVKRVFVSDIKALVKHSNISNKLFICSDEVLKIFDLKNPDQEPEVIDILPKVTSFTLNVDEKYCIVTSRDGECAYYDLENEKLKAKLLRSSLALTDVCFTHGDSMALSGGADGKLYLIDLNNINASPKVQKTIDQITAISYSNIGDIAAVSLSNGDIEIYSYSSSEPTKLQILSSIVNENKYLGFDDDEEDDVLDFENDDLDNTDTMNVSSKIENEKSKQKLMTFKADWHPDGDLLAVPSKTNDILVFNRNFLPTVDFKFPQSHNEPLVDLKWSPNGKYIASAGVDKKLVIYDLKSKDVYKTFSLSLTPCSISWGKLSGSYEIIVGSTAGQIITFDGIPMETAFASKSSSSKSKTKKAKSDLVLNEAEEDNDDDEEEGDDLDIEGDADSYRHGANGAGNPDESSLFGDGEDDFIVDDEGTGDYIEKRKSPSTSTNEYTLFNKNKKRKIIVSQSTAPTFELVPYSVGGTPWAGNRRYITINPTGYAWAVKQEGYNTITVSFFDRSVHKEYHFRDVNNFDIASMNDVGVLFASSGNQSKKSNMIIMFRSHEQSQFTWQCQIKKVDDSEFITSIALSKSTMYVCTSLGYIRRFSLFGRPEKIEKTAPVVACINSEKYLFTVTQQSPYNLTFNVQDLDGKFYQRNEHLPLSLSGFKHPLKGLFFSLDGDPCIVGQDDHLLILARWREPLQATWIPILDTKAGIKSIATGDNVQCWPLGLFKEEFNFVVVRGSDYPSFPLTLPSDITIKIPLSHTESYDADDPEEELARCVTMGELLNDAISNDEVLDETAEERLTAFSIMYDRSLLKQFGQACTEQNSLEALQLASKLRDDKALQAASKIAERMEMITLLTKINKLREARMDFD
ncbi:hypothetical protein BVG19_g3978 [[Candida] boidinii]|nr:hypothetical protein BVG19_g3978 [[Candida] boidinii]OWB51364.1 hypothetical protein B5S27_g2924 [[Candida] boidinii]